VHAILNYVRFKADQVSGVAVRVKPDNLEISDLSFIRTRCVSSGMSTIPRPHQERSWEIEE
jgi:hypothetical protein